MLKSIAENPYRVLGVYANSPKRDQVANKTKMAAFLRVGKSMPFPLDLKGILPEISRNQEMIDKADSELSLAEGQLKAAQFWFIKNTPLDDIAFNNLFQGNIDGALSIWSKQKNVSSLQNSFICSLIKGDSKAAIDDFASVLYSSYKDAFCALIGDNIQKDESELIDTVLSRLQDEGGTIEPLYNSVVNPAWKTALASKVVEPYIKRAESAIAKCKAIKGKTPVMRKNAGMTLMRDCKVVLPKLKKLLSATDSKYRMIADKYAQEILQCGIDYFNGSGAETALEDAAKLQKYALSVAVGAVAKQRCQENVDILNKIAKELPPAAIIENVKNVINKIELASKRYSPSKIEKARTLINETRWELQNIKDKVGSTSEWYIKTSTRVCSAALSWVIDEVNDAQNTLGRELQIAVALDYAGSSVRSKVSECCSVLDSANSVMTMIANCDYDSDFRRHFNEQRTAFNNIRSQINSLSRTSSSSSYGSTRSSTAYSSSSSSSSDEGLWGCISLIIGGLIAFLISQCN